MNKRTAIIIGILALAHPATGIGQAAKPPMVGRWRGEGAVVGVWPRQRTLSVDITIFANDSVAGAVGDATLVGGWFTTRDPSSRVGMRWNTDYIIIAGLDGPVIRAEGISRPTVRDPTQLEGQPLYRRRHDRRVAGWERRPSLRRGEPHTDPRRRCGRRDASIATANAALTSIRILSW